MDVLAIDGIEAHGRHGVLDAEKTLGQPFVVDIIYALDLTRAGQTDELSYSVSYADIYDIVIDEVTHKCYRLIEALAYQIIGRVLAYSEQIAWAEVVVKKPHAPLYGKILWSKVVMKRGRDAIDLSQFR